MSTIPVSKSLVRFLKSHSSSNGNASHYLEGRNAIIGEVEASLWAEVKPLFSHYVSDEAVYIDRDGDLWMKERGIPYLKSK